MTRDSLFVLTAFMLVCIILPALVFFGLMEPAAERFGY